MNIYNKLLSKEKKLAVIGLGYVGMPIAVAFSKLLNVVGFDINEEKIQKYKSGIDPTKEIGNSLLKTANVDFTSEESKLRDVSFYIIAVPTPVSADNMPDLYPLVNASEIVGRNLNKDSIVVYESTVYPGVTEDICIDILEKTSGLKCGVDFKVGYSPERINPGDKIHKLENIKKIVSGIDKESCEEIANIYNLIIKVGVYKASSIKVAEAAKVVENSQRDINIAFMNELAIVFDKMNIDTNDVIEAMNTKWNALNFYPGLVGGHCIGVDPYYFIYEAEKLGYHSQIVLSGRKINDGMGKFVADAAIKELILANKVVKKARVCILGITFKENCPDIRNSKVIDIIKRLQEFGICPIVSDAWADSNDVKKEYGVDLFPIEEINEIDCLIIAVAHNEYRNLSLKKINSMFKECPNNEKVIVDVKSIIDKDMVLNNGLRLWRL